MNYIKKSLFLLILLFLVFLSIGGKFHLFRSKPLNGFYVSMKKPDFTVTSWFSGSFQDSCNKYIKEKSSFHNELVMFYNQTDYSLFSLPHAQKIIVGKKGYLFSEEYITAYFGKNFSGKQFCDEKVRLLKKLQDLLWNQYHILLVVIMAPDKGNFYPEYIPDRYFKHKRGITNYGYYAKKCEQAGINMIDCNRWFLHVKDTSRYPLYPKTGIHWSSYGAVLAADSLLKYLHSKLDIPLPRMIVDRIETSNKARNVDDDIASTLNLIWQIPTPVYAYPDYHFTFDTTQKKPSALFIGDSFYWNWYPDIIRNIFSNEEFWDYNMDVYPDFRIKPKAVSQMDVKETINRQKIIVLMQVNGAKGNIGYGFIDLALSVLDPAKGDEVKRIEDQIHRNPEWMTMVRQKAAKNHISIEEQLKQDALYMIDLKQKGNTNINK